MTDDIPFDTAPDVEVIEKYGRRFVTLKSKRSKAGFRDRRESGRRTPQSACQGLANRRWCARWRRGGPDLGQAAEGRFSLSCGRRADRDRQPGGRYQCLQAACHQARIPGPSARPAGKAQHCATRPRRSCAKRIGDAPATVLKRYAKRTKKSDTNAAEAVAALSFYELSQLGRFRILFSICLKLSD
jgi:hypothetical protein